MNVVASPLDVLAGVLEAELERLLLSNASLFHIRQRVHELGRPYCPRFTIWSGEVHDDQFVVRIEEGSDCVRTVRLPVSSVWLRVERGENAIPSA